jgi:hypothetical protein
MALGSRKFHRMISQDVLISLPKIELKISIVGIETEPKLTFKRNVPSKTKTKTMNSILFF